MIKQEITYHDNYEVKTFREYVNDVLVKEEHYNDKGILDGLHRQWFYNGQQWVEKNYKNGKSHGLHRQWYENGQIYCKINYVNGVKYGISSNWYPNGIVHQERKYKNGWMCELTKWDFYGALLIHKTYTKGLIR